ncbi:MAG: IS200/IS605 family transposase [Alphaproteobacteria bacterium]|nr:IS200/IS605 family transposase [Alphaproteobacteria bacterium]
MCKRISHSVCDIEHPIVFCTKYRRRVLCGSIAEKCIEVIREICSGNYIDIISGSVSPDHVHMLVSAHPHLSMSKVAQYIKWKNGRKLQYEFQELKKKC